MERCFTMEAKSFFFSVQASKSKVRLEERRKGYGGSTFPGIRGSDWLVDTVEEAMLSHGKEEFVKSFREEVKALMVVRVATSLVTF